jgi:diguanylate cyclase (GGDEF)-like protein/PAS domain S-box-containing protein
VSRDSINQTRHRALRAGLLLVAFSSLGGAFIIVQLPKVHLAEWLIFLVVGVAALALLPLVERLAKKGDRDTLEMIGRGVIAMATFLILQRLGWSLYGSLIHDPTRYLFRPTFAFLPFLYLGAMTLMRARSALRFCWTLWALVIAVTGPALYYFTGFSLARDGMSTLMVWLLLANPLFIMMMQALPRYEEQLDRSNAEVAEMRIRTELMDKLTESERRFNLVVEGLDVGVWDRWLGPPEKRWWSPRFYELIGYKPEELSPTEDHLKWLLHPDEAEAVWHQGTEQLKNGDTMDVDFRIRTKSRGYRWFNTHAKAERDANGRMVRLAGSITDIHDQRTAAEALRMAQAELTRLAYRDTLTDLYNRRYFDEHFQREWERARRSGQPLSLILVDLDHFKAYNDQYGHPAGDACLVQIGKLLTRCSSRPADIVARLGGEEFGIVLPETSAIGAEEVAHRMRSLLMATTIPHEGSPVGYVTFSVGIASSENAEGLVPSEMFEQADRALYEVKRRGRNGILRFGAEEPGGQPPPLLGLKKSA